MSLSSTQELVEQRLVQLEQVFLSSGLNLFNRVWNLVELSQPDAMSYFVKYIIWFWGAMMSAPFWLWRRKMIRICSDFYSALILPKSVPYFVLLLGIFSVDISPVPTMGVLPILMRTIFFRRINISPLYSQLQLLLLRVPIVLNYVLLRGVRVASRTTSNLLLVPSNHHYPLYQSISVHYRLLHVMM